MKYFLLMLLAIANMQSFAFTSSKKFNTSISKQGVKEFVVDNKFGNITVKQITGNDIIIEATMNVEAKTQSKADETVEYIAIETTNVADMLTAKTLFGKNMDLKQLFSSTTVYVNYTISLPEGIMLRVINTRGTVSVPKFVGDINMNLITGNLKIGDHSYGELYLVLDDIIAEINGADVVTLKSTAGTLTLNEVKTISLTTGMTNCEIGEAEKVNLNSSGGTIQLKDVEDLFGTASTSKITVNGLTESLNMSMKFGSLNIGDIHRDFEKIHIDANFSKVGLTFMPDAGYNLVIDYNKTVKLDLPPHIVLKDEATDKKTRTKGTAFVGNKNKDSQVTLQLTNGTLYIQ